MTETEQRTNQIQMLIRFYNVQAGASCRVSNEYNQKVVGRALDIANGDIVSLKNHIRDYIAKDSSASLETVFEEYVPPKMEVTSNPNQVGDKEVQYSMGILEQAVIGLIAKTNSDKIESEIMGQVEQKVQDFIKEEYGTIERKVITVIDGIPKPMKGITHDKFETVLKFVANDEPVFLTGPAGSGKNVICKQVAEALGLNFYFTNAVTQEYKLTGFTDAMGNYQETQFYKAFTEGGVFMLDEIDASIPEVLVILNAAIANRYFDFPAPIGYVEAHPDFRVIAAGNTLGHGADNKYVGRNQLDGASLDRFAVIEIDYSEAIENSVAGGDIRLAEFCRAFRKSAYKSGVDVIVSYRGIGRLAKMKQIMELKEALQTCLVKGMDKDDVNIIANGISKDDEYLQALREIVNSL